MPNRRSRPGRLKELRPAPGDLLLVQEFVNTADLEAGTDELSSPRALADWLAGKGLLSAEAELDDSDVERVKAFRERLRSLLRLGERASRELGKAFEQTAASALLRVRVEAGGVIELAPGASGVDAALGRLLAIMAAAQRDGSWARLKGCVDDDCRAAFYDFSTNRSGLWCLPRCGSRVRGRDFRRRQKHRGLS